MAGGTIELKIDTSQVDAALKNNVESQIPFAVSKGLNDAANVAKQELVNEMRQIFDRPTPYTLSGIRVQRATKQKLFARVGFINDAFKAAPASVYLAPQVDGGARSVKRIESLLRARGYLPAGMFVVPGEAAKLDAYGNFSRGQYSQILAQLQASRDSAQNETARSRARKRRRGSRAPRYFVGRPGGGAKPLGVWARYQFASGTAVRPVLMFVRSPQYKPRFRFNEIVESVTARTLPTTFAAALELAMATRRR
ncbi:hypothetical protein [Burkholderia gladioli]|uniref:hypothetical protein n=1 Tax=Burkholderia gladioli TaxID=28095 RepID=UPI001C5D2B28|nr:hypothetical protein [Burkholderia gladioli]MBW5284455.1 hypothetical protein [Burkholderia gladioli]